jgi:hypothetical protein
MTLRYARQSMAGAEEETGEEIEGEPIAVVVALLLIVTLPS